MRVCYDLNGHPPYYGIDTERVRVEQLPGDPPPGFYAIAVHCLLRAQSLDPAGGPRRGWLDRFEPVGRVGYSFYLFKL